MAWTLERLSDTGDCGNNLVHALTDADTPEETREWLTLVIAAVLRETLDEIEADYQEEHGTEGRRI